MWCSGPSFRVFIPATRVQIPARASTFETVICIRTVNYFDLRLQKMDITQKPTKYNSAKIKVTTLPIRLDQFQVN